MKRKTLLSVAALAAFAGAGFFLMYFNAQESDTAVDNGSVASSTQKGDIERIALDTNVVTNFPKKRYVDSVMGVSFFIPENWLATSTVDQYGRIVHSPDYEQHTLYEPGPTKPLEGMSVLLSAPEDIAERIQTTESYLVFQEWLSRDCSNCIDAKRITLDGETALLTWLFDDEESKIVGAKISALHNSQSYTIYLSFGEIGDKEKEIIAEILQSFSFDR